MSTTSPIQNMPHVDLSVDCDTASVGSGNSNLSTGTLQVNEQIIFYCIIQTFISILCT